MRGFLDAAQVGDDGEVEGMGDVLDRLSDRYPWLVDEDGEADEDDESMDKASIRPMNRPPPSSA